MLTNTSLRPWQCRYWLAALLCAGTGIVVVHSQAPSPTAPTQSTVLFGRVLDLGTDAPIAGAVVSLTGLGMSSPSGTPRQSAQALSASGSKSVLTNGGGYFLFRDLPSGRYSIAAAAYGYMNSSSEPRVLEVARSDRPSETTVRLSKYASISGAISDEQGEPFVGIAVSALHRIAVGGSLILRQAAEAMTDDRGIYRLAQLPPGRYVIGVLSTMITFASSLATELDGAATDRPTLLRELMAGGAGELASGVGFRIGDSVVQPAGPAPPQVPAGRMQTYVTTLFPGTTMTADATVITVASGEQRTGIDMSLRPSVAVRVSGVVTGPGGAVKGLAIRLLPPYAVDINGFDPVGAATAISDAAGAFTFPLVAPGHYTLKAARFAQANPNIPNSASTSFWATREVTVGESDLPGLVVEMRPGIRVSGRLEFRNSSGQSVSQPQNCLVLLRPVESQSSRSLPTRPTSDGSFATAGDAAGRYILSIAPSQRCRLEAVALGGRQIPDAVIELANTDVSDILVTLSEKPTRVSGRIAGATGQPASQTDVIVFPSDTVLWREGIFNDRRVRLMHATSLAGFEFSALPVGEYFIAAVDSRLTGDWQDPQFLSQLVTAATKFTLVGSDEKTLLLKTLTSLDR